MEKIHIGKKIKEVWKSSRLKGTEFAMLINKERQVIYNIFARETIDTGLLLDISKALNYDFFNYYSQHNLVSIVSEPNTAYGYATKKDLATLSHTVQALSRSMEKLRDELPEKKKNLKATAGKKVRRTK